MSRKNHLRLAAAGLTAALLLTAPAPSVAAGRWKPAVEASGVAGRVWAWLESLGIAPRPQTDVREKEGSAIDPNGEPLPVPPPLGSNSTQSEGSSDDGAQ